MTVGEDVATTTRRRLSQQSDRVRLVARLRRHLHRRGATFVVDDDDEARTRPPTGVGILVARMKGGDAVHHDLAVKIRMKRYALRMLPREGIDLGDAARADADDGRSVYGMWKAKALRLNDNWGPPEHRQNPMYTPPIERFNINQYMNQGDQDN